jgi:Cu2+-exporting ATPase
VLERLRDVDLWLFDKTGTLTEGRLGVTRVTTSGESGVGSLDPTPPATGPRRRIQESDAESRRDFVLGVAAALEAGIEHPVARALRTQATPAAIAEGVEYRTGYGVTGRVDGTQYTLGSARYVGARVERASNAVYLATARGLVATIELADRLRPSARAAVATLARTADIMLVSGDEPAAVTHVAAEVGIARALAQHAPEDKLRVLRAAQAQGRVVAAVGDGVNDAPLLAAADVSIAMVAGSRLAQAAADVVFTGDDLRVLARLPDLAAATRRVVRENLAWAAGYNLIAVPLAAAGVLAPWMAAVGMSVSSLVVVGNALRLHRAFARGARRPLARLPAAAPVVERQAA